MNKPKLSIIIPYGIDSKRTYISQRIKEKATFYKSDDLIEFIFVEGFCEKNDNELLDIIIKNHHSFYKDNQKIFSQGLCRNLGALKARADTICFLDADCFVSFENINIILNLIQKNPNFMMILPCIYLTKDASKYALNDLNNFLKASFPKEKLKDKGFAKFFALASSIMIVNKYKFLELGGFDSKFIGHGYEDFDLMARLLLNTHNFELLPYNINYDARNWEFEGFVGFRALFALFGYESLSYGLFAYHLYHVEPKDDYFKNKDKNHKRFFNNLKYYLKGDFTHIPKPLSIKNEKILYIARNFQSLALLRIINVYLGDFICKNENDFFDDEIFDENSFITFLQKNNITSLFFPNAYANPKRKIIYDFAKKAHIPFLVFERGALNDAWFFDDTGCNADSSIYKKINWQKDLNPNQIKEIEIYINELLHSKDYLEYQNNKEDLKELKAKLNIKDENIIFIPLQTKNDSAIRYFTYEPFLYDDFLDILDEIGASLKNYKLIVKKHPLSIEKNTKKYKNIIFAPKDTNFISLLELCDFVITLNSGVGLYAMMMQKPCITCAKAFYSFDGLNLMAIDKNDLKAKINIITNKQFIFDYQKMISFIFYLKNDFYSFATTKYEKVLSKKDQRYINKAKNIDFYKLNIAKKIYFDIPKYSKIDFRLDNLGYLPYIDWIKKYKNNKINKALLFYQGLISHSKFYRLFRKFKYNPKSFFKDSKSPIIKFFRIFYSKE